MCGRLQKCINNGSKSVYNNSPDTTGPEPSAVRAGSDTQIVECVCLNNHLFTIKLTNGFVPIKCPECLTVALSIRLTDSK